MPYATALYLLFGFICSFIHQFKYLLHGLPGTGNTKVNKTDKLSKAEKISSMIPSSKGLSSELSNSLSTNYFMGPVWAQSLRRGSPYVDQHDICDYRKQWDIKLEKSDKSQVVNGLKCTLRNLPLTSRLWVPKYLNFALITCHRHIMLMFCFHFKRKLYFTIINLKTNIIWHRKQ